MEKSNLPSNPAQITAPMVKAVFNIEMTRLNYQKILQEVENITWTRENIHQDLLAPANFVASKVTETKEREKRPFIDVGKLIQGAYNDVFNPLNDAISRKANEKKALALKMQEEQDIINKEKDRVNSIKAAIVFFITTLTNEITEADADTKIVLLEKKIGSETQRKSFYQEFTDELKASCDELKPMIKQQKEFIRVSADLNKKQGEAMATGNDDKAVELREKAEELKEVIEENKIRLQQKAFEQIENSGSIIGETTDLAPKASRTWWKWRVDDINLLFKKMPELVDLIANKEKIDSILSEKKENGSLDGKREEKMFGITFYQEQSYKK